MAWHGVKGNKQKQLQHYSGLPQIVFENQKRAFQWSGFSVYQQLAGLADLSKVCRQLAYMVLVLCIHYFTC